jgi:hypothetical protein
MRAVLSKVQRVQGGRDSAASLRALLDQSRRRATNEPTINRGRSPRHARCPSRLERTNERTWLKLESN